ncbi:MAG: glycosyltransferase family 2 protein, partial [Planctomycetaceae bacterium]|nr:glycosyltransferase family 2 protein [Planctomycetaceae bacterium]
VSVFRSQFGDAWELIVVDDGSTDATTAVVREFAADCPEAVLISHPENRGKGAAVRTGVLASHGELVLFADADNATPFSEFIQLQTVACEGAPIACGSRRCSGARDVRRTLPRRLMAAFFSLLVRLTVNPGVRDTQCGFKLFRRDAADWLFQQSREDGYLFDLEILGLASQRELRVVEVPVMWREIPGTKVRVIRDSWRMFCGLFRIRRRLRLQRQRGAVEPSVTNQSRAGLRPVEYLNVSGE